MNMLNTLLKMLRRASLFVCFALISAPVLAGPVSELPENRHVRFDDNYSTNGVNTIWTRQGSSYTEDSRKGTNHFYRANAETNAGVQAYVKWSFYNFRVGIINTIATLSIPPAINYNPYPTTGGTNWCGYFQNTTQSYIESPIFTNGIGKIYFDIRLGEDVQTKPIIKVSIATNILDAGVIVLPIIPDAWQQIDSITLSTTNLLRYSLTLNYVSPIAIRLERTTFNGTPESTLLDDAFVAIDNIRVSEPPADVIMDQGLSPFNVYPSVNENMNVQFRIDNVPGPNTTKAVTRTNVLLVSRWNYLNQKTTPWVTNKMECVNPGDGAGNGELWRPLASPAMPVYSDAGDLEYVLLCYFNGSYYEPKDYTVYPAAINLGLFPSENKSPRIYNANGILPFSGSITNNPFIFQLRLFPSLHNTVTTRLSVNGQPPVALAMTLVGTNKWQAQYDVVTHPEATNLLWFFEATGAYTNTFMTTSAKNYWQITSQSRIQNGALPYGDNCGIADASITNRRADWFGVSVTRGESSYVLFTLDTAKNNYLAGRGEYQNFNRWNTGADDYFIDVDDKEPKVSYSQTFTNGWNQSIFSAKSNWFFKDIQYTAAETLVMRIGPENIMDTVEWNAGSFQYVNERTPGNVMPDYSGTAGQRRNQAVRLLGGSQSLGLGYYQGNENQKNGINGVGKVSYKARLSRPIALDGDYNMNVGWRRTDMTRANYVISTSMNATTMSPEKPSMSVIVYYQHMFMFYEYRITQEPDSRDMGGGSAINAGWDKRIRHEIWKWNGTSTPMLLASVVRTAGGNDVPAGWDAKLTGSYLTYLTEFHVYNPSSTATRLKVKFNQTDITGWTLSNGATAVGNVIEDANTPISYGSYGFHSADCALLVPGMWIENLDTTGSPLVGGPVSVTATSGEWFLAPGIYKKNTGGGFISLPQSTTVKVLTGTSELGPWIPFATNSVTSYAYQTFSVEPKAWSNLCAKIQANDEIGVVIDGVRVESWHGETIPSNWTLTEGWISYAPPIDNWFAHLDASQANPSLIQGVRSERIRGLGSITFDYRVNAAPAQINIQYTLSAYPSDIDNTGWVDITNLTFAAGTGWTNANYYLALAPSTNLYVRIINNIVTNRKASVDLKNIVIWNNPTNSPNSWTVYNMKITDTETDKWWLDKKTEATPRSGYMNNSPTNNTIASRLMDIYNPYIMAPSLTRGLGTISFLARAYTTNYLAGKTNTSISVYATTDARDKPDAIWTKIHTFTGITNGFYRPFFYSYPTVPNNFKAVRLMVDGAVDIPPLVPAPQRVCIDEIAVTEAIYPRFDITSVKLMTVDGETKQPLEGEDIGFEAQLSNVLMEPTNIRVFVTYVLGTNTWGVMNAPIAITNELSQVDVGNRIYRTTGDYLTNGVPELEKYNVVQYLVWATYEGNGPHTVYQTPFTADHFTTPSWYFPVDLNKVGHLATNANKSSWSPYYIVYDVPPGSVWINELNLNELASVVPQVFRNPYIEIAQPAWMDLAGWQVEILKTDFKTRLTISVTNKSGRAILPADSSGYGLYVIGPPDSEAAIPIWPSTTTYPALSTTTTVHQSVSQIKGDPNLGPNLYPGGYRLKRPMGMYEHAIAYDWKRETTGSGDVFAQNEPPPQTPFKYVGREYYNGSLSFTGTIVSVSGQYVRTDSTNTWAPGLDNFNWTPGRKNVGQIFPPSPPPGGSNVLITSTLVSPDGLMHGWQNNTRQNTLLFKMKKGQGTNFVFVADPWFRFYGITSNSVQILSPAEQTAITNYVIGLDNIQKDITLVSSLKLAPNVINLITTQDMLAWLTNFVDRALAPSYFGETPLSFTEQYWLNMDPTQTNNLIFRSQGSPVLGDFGLWLTLQMATIDGAGVTNKVTLLRGDSAISVWANDTEPPAWRPFGQFWISTRSFDDNFLSRTWINAYTNDAAMFKWSLNWNDRRLSTRELTNSPLPSLP